MNEAEEHAKKTLCLAQQCCEGPVDPALLRKFFKSAVLAHWETPANHGRYQEVLGCYGTQPGARFPLLVMMSNEDREGEKVTFPRIVISIGDSKIQKKVIGNVGEYSADNASVETSWQIDSSMVITHIFEDADVALIAAQSTFEFISAFAQEWSSVLALQLFDPVGVSQEKMMEQKPKTYFRVDAAFTLNYNFVITVNTESHRLKVIAHDVTIL